MWISVVLVAAATLGGLGIVQPLLRRRSSSLALVLQSPDVAIFLAVLVLSSNIAVVAAHSHGVRKAVAAAFPLLLGVPRVRNLVFRRQGLLLEPTAVPRDRLGVLRARLLRSTLRRYPRAASL